MLPVSYNKPDTPPIMISDRSFVPLYQDVNDARISHILPDIAIHIVNTSVQQCDKSCARMFTFNMLSDNNWQNDNFLFVFRLAVDHLLLVMRTSAAPPEALYRSSVELALKLYCSQLVLEYPDLQSLISPQMLTASRENVGYLHHLNQEISKMSGTQYYAPHYHQPQQGHAQPVAHNQHQGGQLVWATDPRTGQPVQVMMPAPNYQNAGYAPPQHHAPPSRVNPNFQSYGYQARTRLPDMAPRNPSARDYGGGSSGFDKPQRERYIGDRFEEEERQEDFDVRPGAFVSRYQRIDNEYEPEVIIPARETYERPSTQPDNGDRNVDREKHEIGAHTNVVTNAEQVLINKVQEDLENANVSIEEKAPADTSIYPLIAQLRADKIKSKDRRIVRQYFLVPDLLISTDNVKKQIAAWTAGTTLLSVAQNLQKALDTVSAQDTNEIYGLCSLIREFDRLLTERVNSFLKLTLDVVMDIDSFREDYKDLQPHIVKKYGRVSADLLAVFERDLLKTLKNSPIQEALEGAEFVSLDKEEHGGVTVGYLPNTYSVTLFPLDREVLGIPIVKKHDVRVMLGYKNKVIFNAMRDLFQKDPADPFEGVAVQNHLLVTRDGAVYRVIKARDTDELLLLKF